MKRYKEYMDSVEVSPEFHNKLMELEKLERTPNWKKYGAVAAALVLVIGGGVFGMSRIGWGDTAGRYVAEDSGTEVADLRDIAPEEPGTDTDDTMETDGGYELSDGMMTAYFPLPAIVYNQQSDSVSYDYSLVPPGSLSREVTLDDLSALVDGANASEHLLWTDGLSWSGVLWFREDGTPCAASLWADGETVSFGVELMAGGEVPDCVRVNDEYYETTVFHSVEITALKNMGYAVVDGVEMKESRKISFYANNTGCKLTIYGTDADAVEAMCARFARWGIVEGFDLAAMEAGEATDPYGDGNTAAEP